MNKQYLEMNPVLFWGRSLEHVVNQLLDYRNRNLLVVVKFNGTKLYSDTVEMNEAYMKITGMTKDEFDKQKAETLHKGLGYPSFRRL